MSEMPASTTQPGLGEAPLTRDSWFDGPGFFVFVACLMGILSMSMDILLPALPAIAAQYTSDTPNRAQLHLTAFIFSFGAAHPVFGLLADRFGRRAVLMAGLAAFSLTGLFCALTVGFGAMLTARCIQGFAAAGPRIIATAVVRDVKTGPALAKTMSLVMTIFMAAPIASPFIGQRIMAIGGWRAIFFWLFLLGLLLLAVSAVKLPETLSRERRIAFNPSELARTVRALAAAPATLGYTAISSILYGLMFATIACSPQIYDRLFNASSYFTLLFASFGLSIASAAFLNARLVQSFPIGRIVTAAASSIAVVSVSMLIVEQTGRLDLVLFETLMSLLMFGKGLAFSNCMALALQPHGRIAGIASAAIGGSIMVVSSLLAFFIGSSFNGSLTPLLMAYSVLSCVALCLAFFLQRRTVKGVVTLTGLPRFRVGRSFRRCRHSISVSSATVFRRKSLLTPFGFTCGSI